LGSSWPRDTLTGHEGGCLPWTTELTGRLLPGDNVLAAIVGGGFIRSLPGAAGQVTLTATHPTLGRASAELQVTATNNIAL
jgi:hypothetical protein